MSYQEKFDITEASGAYFGQQFDILITGLRDEDGEFGDERHIHFRNSLSSFAGIIYRFDTCDNVEKFHYRVESANGELKHAQSDKFLIPDLEKLLNKDNFRGARVCIDITTIKQGLLFLLIKLFVRDVKPSHLFAGYTEPVEYKKREISVIGEEEFDLYDRVLGSSKSVPGFSKSQSQNKICLIAPMGFDTQRLQTIYESLNPHKLIPIVGFPSFVPGWNLTAIKMNYMVLRTSGSIDMVETCEAASPFYLYDLINEAYHRNVSNYDIYISPLGTRPHCLGAALFASNFPSVFLVYDFPVEKKFRSDNVLKTNIYYLSKYIR